MDTPDTQTVRFFLDTARGHTFENIGKSLVLQLQFLVLVLVLQFMLLVMIL